MAAAHLRPLAQIDGHADRAVAVVLDGIGLALAHRDGEAVGLGDFAFRALRAARFRALEHDLRQVAQRLRSETEAVALRHGGAMITAMQEHSALPPVSKTKRKQQMHELQALGVALVELPETQLHEIEIPQALREAVLEAKRIKSHEAKRRQLQYIGRLMRELDPAAIRARLDAIEGSSAEATARHRRLEALRERLLEDDGALTDYVASHAGADLQALRTLIRNARREQKEGRPPRAHRELFRLLKALETRTAAAS